MNAKLRKKLIINNIVIIFIMLGLIAVGCFGRAAVTQHNNPLSSELEVSMGKKVGTEYREKDHIALFSVIGSSDEVLASAMSATGTLSFTMLMLGGLTFLFVLYNTFMILRYSGEDETESKIAISVR